MEKKSFKSRFWNRPLQAKISEITLTVALVPFLVFCTLISIIYNRAYENRSNQQIKEELTVMSDRIEKVFSDTELCSNYLTLNLNNIYQEKMEHQVDKDNMIKSILNQTVLIFDGLDSLVFFDTSENMYSTNYNLYNKKDEILQSDYMLKLKQTKNGKSILFDKLSTCMMRDMDSPVVTMGKRITHIRSGETIGFLFLNVNVHQLELFMQNGITTYFLQDEAGSFVIDYIDESKLELFSYAENSRNIKEAYGMKIFKANHRKYLMAEIEIPTYKWTLIGFTDLSAYNVSLTQILRIVIISMIIIYVLLMFSSVLLSKMLTNPLKQLEEGAEEIAKGNLEVEFNFKHDDEIGKLGRIFNHMTKEIANLFNRVELEAKKRTSYELALVQEQVKPHFLYNTLDIIIMLIEMNKPREASRVTKKLADYYKNSLASSKEIITLEKELYIIEDYLDLQLMRYEDKFDYDIKIDEDLYNVNIPKMTIQPLVENAIYHGLKYKEDWGTIHIAVTKENEYAKLVVQDDGIGMKEDTIRQILSKDASEDGHFGVFSVVHRLQLYYGELCKIDVQSKEGEGTSFIIYIPIDWKEGTKDA